MKTYKFSFVGRQSGAIGIFHKINDTYKANDIHEAMSLLYTDYEHIQGLSIKENNKDIEEPKKINWIKVRSHHDRPRSKDRATYLYNNLV